MALDGTPIFAPSGQAPIFRTPPLTGEGPVAAGVDEVVEEGDVTVVEAGAVEAVDVGGFEAVEEGDDVTGEGEFAVEMGADVVVEVVEDEQPITNRLITKTNDTEIVQILAVFTNCLL
jgi:hypothetical protein